MSPTRPDALVYAVRREVVLHHMGQIGIVLGLLGLPSIAVALAGAAWMEAGMQCATAVLTGLAGWGLTRRFHPDGVQVNEALVISAGAFLLASAVAAVSMAASGLGPVDALFEATSGVTTTGLTVLSDPGQASSTLQFNRAWTQWYGGLGFVTLASTMLGTSRHVNRVVGLEENLDDLVGGMRAHGRRVLKIYLALTAAGILALSLAGVGWFDSVLHIFASVSTGGFSSHAESLNAFSVPARAVVAMVFLFGAVSFVTLHRGVRISWHALVHDAQLRMLLATGAAASALILLFEWMAAGGGIDGSGIGHALLTGFSAQTTTGFSTWEPANLSNASKIVILFAMFVGGSSGSTAGGIKQARLMVVFATLRSRILRTAMPRQTVYTPRVAGEKLESEEASKMLGLIVGLAMVIAVVWLAFAAYGYPPGDALFDVVSAAGTVGLSTGIVGPGLESPLKLLLVVTMLIGRLELIAVLVLLSPGTWFGIRKGSP